jgi:hypothetical protein
MASALPRAEKRTRWDPRLVFSVLSVRASRPLAVGIDRLPACAQRGCRTDEFDIAPSLHFLFLLPSIPFEHPVFFPGVQFLPIIPTIIELPPLRLLFFGFHSSPSQAPAIAPMLSVSSWRQPTSTRTFDKADNGSDDGTGDAAAHRLAEQLADIDTTGSPLKHRQQRSEKRPTACAAKRAGNGVAERTQIKILHRRTCGIARR